jgi:CubicO group peptidase (beta-lactamase class C family)
MPADASPLSAALRRDPTKLDDVYARLRERVGSNALPAAALAVGDADGEIRSEAFAAKGEIRTDSLFFLASVTKPIFATAFMQLVESGAISLDAPIVRYIPEFANAPGKADVTSVHLLTHTSGVPDYPPDRIRRDRPSAAAMTHHAPDTPHRFTPATRYEYCSASFDQLAPLIEQASGQRYTDYLRQRVLEPLGMLSTFDPRRSGRPIVTVHGVGVDNVLTRFLVLRYLAATAVPGGGLFGTLDDLLRFGAATLRPTRDGERYVPLSPASIELMRQDHLRGVPGTVDGEEKPVHFGLGWGKPTLMRDIPGSKSVVSHGGAVGTRIWVDHDAGLVIVFFSNQWSPERGPENEAIAGVYGAIGTA